MEIFITNMGTGEILETFSLGISLYVPRAGEKIEMEKEIWNVQEVIYHNKGKYITVNVKK